MFKCAVKNHDSQPREKLRRLVTATRDVVYPDGSKGWEIVAMTHLCMKHFWEATGLVETVMARAIFTKEVKEEENK